MPSLDNFSENRKQMRLFFFAFFEVVSLFLFQIARWRSIAFRPGFSIATNVLHPKSRGRVSLYSRNIDDQPKIEPNYFTHPHDVKIGVLGAKLAMRVRNT
jgi:choline dehydrogenase-like flavoprotein